MQIDEYMHLNPGVEATPKTYKTKLELRDKQQQIEQSVDGLTLIFVVMSHKSK